MTHNLARDSYGNRGLGAEQGRLAAQALTFMFALQRLPWLRVRPN